jgi:DNA-directed RNA polymerase subunit beta
MKLYWVGWSKARVKFATPIFDGATLDEIIEYTSKSRCSTIWSYLLYDGGTGERFDQPQQ